MGWRYSAQSQEPATGSRRMRTARVPEVDSKGARVYVPVDWTSVGLSQFRARALCSAVYWPKVGRVLRISALPMTEYGSPYSVLVAGASGAASGALPKASVLLWLSPRLWPCSWARMPTELAGVPQLGR